jgi:hypothetical protein
MMFNKVEDLEQKVDSFGESVKKLAKQKKTEKAEIKKELTSELKTELTSDLSVKLDSVAEEIKRLESEMQDHKTTINKKVSTLDNKIDENKEVSEKKWKDQTLDRTLNVAREVKNQENRRHNLIVFNLKESVDESEEKRNESDVEEITKRCDEVCDFTVTVCKAWRVGQSKEGKPRPLKIQLTSEDQCMKVLNKSWEIGKPSDEYYRIFINKDLTPLEQGRRKELVLELKKKREETARSGENKNWVIKRGKVVEKEATPPLN